MDSNVVQMFLVCLCNKDNREYSTHYCGAVLHAVVLIMHHQWSALHWAVHRVHSVANNGWGCEWVSKGVFSALIKFIRSLIHIYRITSRISSLLNKITFYIYRQQLAGKNTPPNFERTLGLVLRNQFHPGSFYSS